MIKGGIYLTAVGIDLERISRFSLFVMHKDRYNLSVIFTDQEVEYCFSRRAPAQHLAVRFCAKEAVIKALHQLGIHNHGYSNIEIVHDSSGFPVAILKNSTVPLSIKISLSHDGHTAAAFSIVSRV